MNLVENYILKVYSVEDITEEFEKSTGIPAKSRMVRVKMRVDCYGRKEDAEHIFPVEEWKEAGKRGYYLS